MEPVKRGSITVVEQVYHRSAPDENPTCASVGFERAMASSEQIYHRVLDVGEGWVPLDCGWVKKPSLLLLVNRKTRFAVIPTPEQQAAADAAVLEVELHEACSNPLLVYPGESQRFCPRHAEGIRLRCITGSLKLDLYAYPE